MKEYRKLPFLMTMSPKTLTNPSSNELFISRHDGEKVHCMHQPRPENNETHVTPRPGVIFAPGFQSSLQSTKVQAIMGFCEKESLEFTSLDYHCHGESSCLDQGKSNIGRWKSDLISVLDNVTSTPRQILVGSSMGAWLMMLVCKERPDRIGGLLGIASAPDFTTIISEQIKNSSSLSSQMETMGYCDLPTIYDSKGYYRIHRQFLEEAEKHFILSGENHMNNFSLDIPIRLIHGKKDQDIHYSLSERFLNHIQSEDKELILLEDGDHRLSKPDEIEVIINTLQSITYYT